jgi:hypothetical protein
VDLSGGSRRWIPALRIALVAGAVSLALGLVGQSRNSSISS